MRRFSCRAVVQYTDEQGRFLLVVDREWYELYGEIKLTAPGGYIHTDAMGIQHLQEEYDASGFENGMELRFYAPQSRYRDVCRWFRERTHRDTDVERILLDQLWNDPFYGRPLQGAIIRNVSRPLLGVSAETGYTIRPGVAETATTWLIDTHVMRFHSNRMHHALAEMDARNPHLSTIYFARIEEIQDGFTFEGDVPIETRLAQRLVVQDIVIGG